jgi:HSP20 family molecular chaperone IbpA
MNSAETLRSAGSRRPGIFWRLVRNATRQRAGRHAEDTMPSKMIREGDNVLVRAEVTRISEDGVEVTVRLSAFGYPITLRTDVVERVEKRPLGKARKPAFR